MQTVLPLLFKCLLSSHTNSFAVKVTSFPLRFVNINASDGECRHINHQSSSSKPKTKHCLIRKLNLHSAEQPITPAIKNCIDFGLAVLAVHFTTNEL
jgi:hypothetical protein